MMPLNVLFIRNQILMDLIENLSLPFTDNEILDAFNSIDDEKTLGIDGFTTKFFKHNWELIGKQFLMAVQHFFSTKKLPQMFKHTLITLIPKSKNANSISEFCPISLCITFYKVVAKCLANKLKDTLLFIISNSQLAFIKGRDISDNIALTQELCGELHSGLHGKAFCAKIDLRKAFDTINRKSIINRMAIIRFSRTFLDWIEACITDIPFSIICNGFYYWICLVI